MHFGSFPPHFERYHPEGGLGPSHLSSPSTNLTRGLTVQGLLRVPPHATKANIETSMPLKDLNPGLMAQQPTSLTTIPDQKLGNCIDNYEERKENSFIFTAGKIFLSIPVKIKENLKYYEFVLC
ncbi:hypothetical protein TNCV_1771071 [Trichonephila clavipes]|nr:hypothetical protein TNCV_1771071 [Trichonephila clavipes]